jgi:protein-S-isoprenylcysteine O-methyltransferase Ste14
VVLAALASLAERDRTARANSLLRDGCRAYPRLLFARPWWTVGSMPAGRHDGLWFGLQSAFFLGLLVSPVVERRRTAALVRSLGAGLAGAGAIVAVAGYRELGEMHSPWTAPRGTGLVKSGIYSRIRHPIYAGWCLGGLGLEILAGSRLGVGAVAALAVFYDVKSREEDKLLVRRYPDADGYIVSVKRFVPRVY